MSISTNSRQLDVVARDIGETYLHSQGFSRAGSVFHRELEPGFVHIVDIGLGPSWSMYADQCTVDICVFIREAFELFFSKPMPRRLTGTHCDLRMRLGTLDNPPKDHWWSLSLPREALVTEIGEDIERLALPFLARIASRRALIDTWFATGNEILGLPPRGDLIMAATLKQIGDHANAAKVLSTALEASSGQRGEEFYSRIAAKLQA